MLVWLVMFLAATAAVSADAPSEVPKEGFYLSIEGIKPQEVVPLLPREPTERNLTFKFSPSTIAGGGYVCLRLIQPNGVGTQWQCLFASESSPVAVVKLILDMTGTHGLEFRAAETKDGPIIAESSMLFSVVSTEMVLTYEWAPIQEYHRVPAGAEFRLSLDGSGRKEARIPTPWQLTIDFGSPHRIYRTFVSPTSSLQMIKQAAASLSGIPSGCMYLTGVESPTTAGSRDVALMTVQDLDWFGRRDELRLKLIPAESNPECKPELFM